MLARVKCPVLFTHHLWRIDEATGRPAGRATLRQIDQVEALVKKAGQPFSRINIPDMGQNMHLQDPEQFVRLLVNWTKDLPTEEEVRANGVFAGTENSTAFNKGGISTRPLKPLGGHPLKGPCQEKKAFRVQESSIFLSCKDVLERPSGFQRLLPC